MRLCDNISNLFYFIKDIEFFIEYFNLFLNLFPLTLITRKINQV